MWWTRSRYESGELLHIHHIARIVTVHLPPLLQDKGTHLQGHRFMAVEGIDLTVNPLRFSLGRDRWTRVLNI